MVISRLSTLCVSLLLCCIKMRPLAFIKDQNLIVTNPRLDESECRSTFGRIPAPFPPLSGQGQF